MAGGLELAEIRATSVADKLTLWAFTGCAEVKTLREAAKLIDAG